MIEIIPAIDIIGGKCVRLTKGDYNQKTSYSDQPLEVAQRFEDAGIHRLHLVDLDGAKASHIVNKDVLYTITSKTSLKVDFGGGIKSDEDIEQAFDAGASQVTGGSIAVKDKQRFLSWLEKYGNEKLILGADVQDGKIAVSGWQEDTDEEILDFVEKYAQKGVKYVISTDISKDGALQGPSFELYQILKEQFPNMYIIASGGVTTVDDIRRLNEMGIDGVIIGKAYYEGRITLEELKEFLV